MFYFAALCISNNNNNNFVEQCNINKCFSKSKNTMLIVIAKDSHTKSKAFSKSINLLLA